MWTLHLLPKERVEKTVIRKSRLGWIIAFALGCVQHPTPVKTAHSEASSLADSGRTVVRVLPRTRTPLGILTSQRSKALAEVDAIDAHATKGIHALKERLLSAKPWLRLAALQALAGSRHPDAALQLLILAGDPHPRVTRELRDWIDELSPKARETLFDKGAQKPGSRTARAALRLWPLLLIESPQKRLLPLFSILEIEDKLALFHGCPPALPAAPRA